MALARNSGLIERARLTYAAPVGAACIMIRAWIMRRFGRTMIGLAELSNDGVTWERDLEVTFTHSGRVVR
jgi:hypothetical protein